PETEEAKVLPMCTDYVGGRTLRPLSTSVRWKGREYGVEAGIDLVMSVVRRPEENAGNWNAATALGELANLGPHLRGRPCLDELATLYDHAQGLEKRIILTCFLGSGDPRGIALFIRTLDKEQNMRLRLRAASALAQWNIRRGLAELVDLLESKERLLLPGGLMPYVRDKALDLFRTKNRLKGWGFPDEEIRESIEIQLGIDPKEFEGLELEDEETRKSIETRARLLREKFLALYIGQIKKWFAENEHRFPDWKPGDPLPDVRKPEKNDLGKE
ncbi:MAG: hypothetical protein WBE26_03745, partial [Phycisphaerae bacterium]